MLEFILSNTNLILNQTLRLDPELHDQLKKFSGKIIEVQITNLGLSVYVILGHDNIILSSQSSSHVDTIISASLFTFLTTFFQALINEDKLPKNFSIKGNIDLAQELFYFFKKFEIDWQEQIAKFCGDTFATQLGNGINYASDYVVKNLQTLKFNLREYLQEEVRILPPKLEIDDFLNYIDHLRVDVDRLEARIKRLLKESTALS